MIPLWDNEFLNPNPLSLLASRFRSEVAPLQTPTLDTAPLWGNDPSNLDTQAFEFDVVNLLLELLGTSPR